MSKKLIRLHTEDEESIFDTVFNEEININPNSEIALHSISFAIANRFLIVDADNDTFTFEVNGNVSTHTINIPHGTYTKYNSTQLLETLTNRMNQELNIIFDKEHGTSIVMNVNNSTKLQIVFGYADQMGISTDVNDVGLSEQANVDTGSRATAVGRDIAEGDDFSSYQFGLVPFTKGCGNIKFDLTTFGNGATTDKACVFGITRDLEKLKNSPELFTDADFDHYYQIGIKEDTTIVQGSDMSMELSQGKITFKEYLAGGGSNELKSEDFDYTDLAVRKYYFAIFYFAENTHFAIEEILWSPEPHEIPENVTLTTFAMSTLSAIPQPQGLSPSVYQLTWGDISLRDYFGFDLLALNPTSVATDTGLFTAKRHFANTVSSDNYMIEMLNMNLDSYDSFSPNGEGGGHKNILAMIPISERIIDNQTGLVQYEPNELNYISIRNEYGLSLRNIKLRLIDFQHAPVFNSGFISLNVIIRDSK